MATPKSVTPDVSASGMKPGDAEVKVEPVAGGGFTMSPMPLTGARRRSKKAGRRSRRRGGAEGPDMVEGARRRRKTAGRRRRGGSEMSEGARRRRH
jgi:hypothetical protein